jgi:hydroxypyruvate isomerase
MNQQPFSPDNKVNRRHLLKQAAGLTAAGAFLMGRSEAEAALFGKAKAAKKGNIKHSIVQWPFEALGDKWDIEKQCQVAKELGAKSIELVPTKHYPIIKKNGLTCAIAQIDMGEDPPFLKGFNNPTHWPKVMKATEDAINAAAEYQIPSVICFTGYSARDVSKPNGEQISKEEGMKNCVEGYKKIIGLAEKKGINLCLEMLNSRETSHPMKGHPGYMGDHTDYCIELIKKVGSPRMKLLFDIYHVQIMDGDVIKRIREYKDYIGHVHTAGNPGRNELDDKQEISFPPIMKALVEVGYKGYVGHEFIPTRNPYKGLQEAISLCDV